MTTLRPHRFPPLSQLTARVSTPVAPLDAHAYREAVSDGFQQGLDKGYQEGLSTGQADGHTQGYAQGHAKGLQAGQAQAREEVMRQFDGLSQPVEAMLTALQRFQADYHQALRKEVVDLVAKVARQVIRGELALQPTQLLTMVDETLAVMPEHDGPIEVFLHPEECQRLMELAPERANQWRLRPDAALEHGECRIKVGDQEADAGCHQRLNACMEQVRNQLLDPATP